MRIRCPKCGEVTTWEENPHRPFCSDKCRLNDLGAWATGAYRIPVTEEEDEDGDKGELPDHDPDQDK